MKLLDRLFSVIERLTCSLTCCTQDVKVKAEGKSGRKLKAEGKAEGKKRKEGESGRQRLKHKQKLRSLSLKKRS